MSSEIDISVRNLTKVYRIYERPEHRLIQMATLGRVRRFTEFSALSDVSLDIRRGETVGIIGRNGCGKSTLLQIICGTLQPTSGAVEVKGRIAALLELGAGFNGEFTGRENAYMNGAILGFSREEMDARFEAIKEFAGIGEFIERPVKTYSSGMFVRLAFAVATAVEPDILIVDEALSVGDEAFQRKCFARIEAIKERGGTILFVSHGAQTIVQLCDRAVLLDGGEKLLEGSPKMIVGQYQRLVNASPEAATHIRAAILDVTTSEEHVVDASEKREIRADEVAIFETSEQFERLDYFDPSLVSISAVELDKRGAQISNVRITNLSGKDVNNIKTGLRYIFSFKVEFQEAAQNIGFGMSIKTTNGIELGVNQTFRASEMRTTAKPGATFIVEIEFYNSLLHGTYFFTAGVQGTVGSDHYVMHRIVDAIMVKVRYEDDMIASGFIDFGALPRIVRSS